MQPLLVVAAVIRDGEGAARACWRAAALPGKDAAGRWEFPGGKVEAGESPQAALAREIARGTRCRASVSGTLLDRTVTVRADGRAIDLACYDCRLDGPAPTASTDHDELRWLPVGQLAGLDWAEADLPAVTMLTARDRGGRGGRVKALYYERFGGPVEVAELPDPAVPAGGAIDPRRGVRTLPQRLARLGRTRRHACALPHVPGHEFAGVVEAVGAGVTRLATGRPGDRAVRERLRRVRVVPGGAGAGVPAADAARASPTGGRTPSSWPCGRPTRTWSASPTGSRGRGGGPGLPVRDGVPGGARRGRASSRASGSPSTARAASG